MDVKNYLEAKETIEKMTNELVNMSYNQRSEFAKKVNELKFEKKHNKKHNKKHKTSIDKSKFGVHKTHCCIQHGCKYGDDDCPVVLGIIKQEYVCEDCTDFYMF